MRQQVTRLAIAFGVMILSLVAARHFLIPETFGEIGHYRAAAVDAVASHEIKYAGREACGMCHEDVLETHGDGRHAGAGRRQEGPGRG